MIRRAHSWTDTYSTLRDGEGEAPAEPRAPYRLGGSLALPKSRVSEVMA